MRSYVRLLSVFVLILSLFGRCDPVAYAQENEPAAATQEAETRQIRVRFVEGVRVHAFSCTYSDTCFYAPATQDQPELAMLSVLGAASTYTKIGGRGRNYASLMMEKCGFTPKDGYLFSANGEKSSAYTGFSTSEDNDHCRVQLGCRAIPQSDPQMVVIAVFLNGYTRDQMEWLSNFNVGEGDDHAGFHAAAEEACTLVSSYAEECRQLYGEEVQYKFWITGHSRAAAIANILAIDLTEEYGEEHVYAYGFATPAYSKSQTNYENIKNYVIPGDIVPKVVPEEWGFYRNDDGAGEAHQIPVSSGMKRIFRRLAGKRYQGFSDEDSDRLVKELLATGIRQENYEKEQDQLRQAAEELSAGDYWERVRMLNGFGDAHRILSYIAGIAALGGSIR